MFCKGEWECWGNEKNYTPYGEAGQTEALTQRSSKKKVLWKNAANLQENTHAGVWFQ